MTCKHRGDFDSSPTLWERFKAAWKAFRNPNLVRIP